MILKSLELAGFKSFADKTRFEFSDGVTIVVGPNGSGKSNVVDAIKWVLGEQKVKSLRGKEMTDVIFAGATGRKPMNAAEVTLTFDNSAGRFHIDAPELQITRRVTRAGDSEYQINRQTSRLKDIKDLLAGTGIGTQAYCIIEQGKVDSLLQSSPKDRRAIFEEAAGISGWNLKSQSTLRRFEVVSGNLQRLNDMISDAEGNRRNLKRQAQKAAEYHEYTQRLQSLRIEAGIVDWNNLTRKIESHDARFEGIRLRGEELQTQIAQQEKLIAQIESDLSELDSQVSELDNKYSNVRETIASNESNAANQIRRLDEIHQQQTRYQTQSARLVARTSQQSIQRRKTEQEYSQALTQKEALTEELTASQAQLAQLQKEADEIETLNEKCRKESLEKTRTVAALTSEISSLERQLEAKDEHRRSDQMRLEEAEAELNQSAKEKDEAIAQTNTFNEEKETCEERVLEIQYQWEDIDEQILRLREQLDKLRINQTSLRERIRILDELESKREDLNPGLKEALKKAKEEPDGPFGGIEGLASDMMQVGVEAAGLIEIALGEKAEYLVVNNDGGKLAQALKNGEAELPGRLGFIWLDGQFSNPVSNVNLEGRPGVVGRADQFVQSEKKYLPLIRRLLGNTWIVETAADAFSLSNTVMEPLNYVTLAGDRLSSDGSFACGVRQAAGGSIARRSELGAKKATLENQNKKYAVLLEEAKALEENAVKKEQTLTEVKSQLRKARANASDAVNQLTALEERFLQVQRRKEEIVHSMTMAQQDRKEIEAALKKAIDDKKASQEILSELETTAQRLRTQGEQNDEIKRQVSRQTTQKQVQLAQCEERCEGLKTSLAQDDKVMDERIQDIDQCAVHLVEQRQAEMDATMSFLTMQSQLAQLYLKKEKLQGKLNASRKDREKIAENRHEFAQKHTALVKDLQKIEKQLHGAEMEKSDWEHQRADLAQRLKEDYDIDIRTLSQNNAPAQNNASAPEKAESNSDCPSAAPEVSPEVQKEIKQLRNKIAALGAINMEALNELEVLDKKYELMSKNHNDLTEAKQNIEKAIDETNQKAQRSFLNTVNSVREKFNNLFGDLFGGGRAEIIIEENENFSEAGIEIVAQPPGKELSHISLLSGGEKTLTCVALLLAMFEANPSPFCILDEVDAALDEANTDRFSKVLKRFEKITQFICISHSKRTMSVADTIYGITMQESGVSRQLSVRFEDVTDDGDIVISA